VAPPDDRSDDAEEGAFDLVKRCLDGGPRASLGKDSSKLLSFVLGGASGEGETTHTGRDVEIAESAFVIHFGPQKARRPSEYPCSLALSVISQLMTLADLRTVTRPVVVGLPAGRVPEFSEPRLAEDPHGPKAPFPAWSYGPTLLWFVPGADTVRLVVRPGAEAWHRPWSRDIPVDGPLALPPEPPAWRPEVPVFASFREPIACPHCQSSSSRYRQTADVLICSHCARSFREKRHPGSPFRPA
jgi:hypothetical protein